MEYKDNIMNRGYRSCGRDLTLFSVTVVVAMSDLIVQQEQNINSFGIFVLTLEFAISSSSAALSCSESDMDRSVIFSRLMNAGDPVGKDMRKE